MEHSIGFEWRYGVSIRLLVFDESPEAFHTIPVCVSPKESEAKGWVPVDKQCFETSNKNTGQMVQA
jgi:hypothetical protein